MKRIVRCSTEHMTDEEIKERISREILKMVGDAGLETALRRIIFYKENKIDWQDAWQKITDQMPEIR